MPKKGEHFRLQYYEQKNKVNIYDLCRFGSILVPEDNGKQIPNESYTKQISKHVVCSYGCELVCVDDKCNNLIIIW